MKYDFESKYLYIYSVPSTSFPYSIITFDININHEFDVYLSYGKHDDFTTPIVEILSEQFLDFFIY
jgi:hypothetical protein